MRGLLLVIFALLIAAPAAAADSVGRMLVALERDIDAATVHAAVLRDRFAADVAPDEGADIAGIADGGAASTLRALRLAARAVDRRLERLRLATADGLAPDRAAVVLTLRASVATLQRTLAGIPSAPDPDARAWAERERRLATLDATLIELEQAATALARFDWGEP